MIHKNSLRFEKLRTQFHNTLLVWKTYLQLIQIPNICKSSTFRADPLHFFTRVCLDAYSMCHGD